MRTIRTLALLLACAACGGSTSSPPEGPLKLGIVAGNNQVAPAGSAKLTDPVVGRLVRVSTASGPRFEFVKTAYAQTVVTGSPVPGAVVCAVSVTAGSMVPFVPCTNTDANGTATFFFTPGTKAGEAESEIRGTLSGQPAVFDTAKATVLPGPVTDVVAGHLAWNCTVGGVSATCMKVGETIDFEPTVAVARDQYGNDVSDWKTSASLGIAVRDGSEQGQPTPDFTGTIKYVIEPKWAGKRIFVYFWIGSFRGVGTVDVQ
jgi:hypothetical protein